MESEPSVTFDVQNYRLLLPKCRSTFLLQCPVLHEASRDDKILVRQHQGANNNQVSLKTPGELVSEDGPPHETYVHGIFLGSRPGENCRNGDAVWLHDAQRKPGTKLDPEAIAVVNLRTWNCITVSLWEVCWVPKYRRIQHGEREEELLTISGPPVRHAQTKKTHVLAIVQRMRAVNNADYTSYDTLWLDIKELVQQDLFKYQNLTNLPEGTRRIQGLFGRMLRAMTRTQATRLRTSKPVLLERMVDMASSLTTPPSGDHNSAFAGEDEDTEFEREAQELIREGMANLTRPLRLAVPKVCNLPVEKCPTPPHLFFATKSTRPTHANPFPKHHHAVDASCPQGAAHELHCVYASAHVPDCIIPTTVRHMCCTTGVYPWNKRITKPPSLRPEAVAGTAGVSVIVKGGSGVTVVSSGGSASHRSLEEEAYADLAIDVEIMCFDARRDLDACGRRAFGVGEREDVVDGEWMFAGASLDGVVGDLCAAVSVPMPGPDAAPASPQAKGSVSDDAFGDRHYYADDDDDDDDDDDAADDETMCDGSYEESLVSGWT